MDAEHKHNWDWQGVCVDCQQSSTQFYDEIEKQREILRRRRGYWQSQGRPDIAEQIQNLIDQLPEVRWTTSEILVI
jgi:hypothetical protein